MWLWLLVIDPADHYRSTWTVGGRATLTVEGRISKALSYIIHQTWICNMRSISTTSLQLKATPTPHFHQRSRWLKGCGYGKLREWCSSIVKLIFHWWNHITVPYYTLSHCHLCQWWLVEMWIPLWQNKTAIQVMMIQSAQCETVFWLISNSLISVLFLLLLLWTLAKTTYYV